MNSVFSVIGLATITLFLSLFLKQYKPEYALLSALAGCVLIAMIFIGSFSDIKQEIENLLRLGQIDDNVLKITFKSLGICYITSFASSYCKDFGFSSIALKIELCGRVAVVILTLPLIGKITEIALELIG